MLLFLEAPTPFDPNPNLNEDFKNKWYSYDTGIHTLKK
jgi:hypothetical protein